MIAAYKAGVPGGGQTFPDGSMIVKLQMDTQEEHRSTLRRGSARCVQAGLRYGKDSKRFPEDGRLGLCSFQLRCWHRANSRADPTSLSDCGNACHTAVKSKDYIFHPYRNVKSHWWVVIGALQSSL